MHVCQQQLGGRRGVVGERPREQERQRRVELVHAAQPGYLCGRAYD